MCHGALTPPLTPGVGRTTVSPATSRGHERRPPDGRVSRPVTPGPALLICKIKVPTVDVGYFVPQATLRD